MYLENEKRKRKVKIFLRMKVRVTPLGVIKLDRLSKLELRL